MSVQQSESPQKVSRWDRPKPPHDWRWVVGGIGRILITLGLLMFAFVAYQLWGTGIQTAQAQRTLSAEFDRLLAETSTTAVASTTTAPSATEPITTATIAPAETIAPATTPEVSVSPAAPLPDVGAGVARLEIPSIGVNRIVVEGATVGDLAKGPGHFPETPLPGQLGNAAIAGHRTTYGAPFYDIDQLQPGDEIIVTTINGRYVYQVTGTEIVAPEDYAAVIPTSDPSKATLTLVSCTPRYTAKNRLVVRSELVSAQSSALTVAPVAEPVADPVLIPTDTAATVPESSAAAATTVPSSSTPDTTAPLPVETRSPSSASPDSFADGWFSDTAAIPQTIMWALVVIAVGIGIYVVSRRARRYLVGILAGFAPFIVALYFFYENVNRLLPPNL